MSSPSPDPDLPRRGEHAQALLMLLPALVLAWPGPGSFLRHEFLPAATGTAVALIASLPAVILLVLRGHTGAARGWLLLLPLLVWGLVGRASDGFERQRAIEIVLLATLLLACGASLGPLGRRTLARGLVVISIAYTLVAHLDGSMGHSGALGNTGSVSQAALAGAVIGAASLLESWGPWTVVYALAVLLQVGYVARMPVLAGALALATGLGLFAALARVPKPARVAAACVASLAVLLTLLPLERSAAPAPAAQEVASAPAHAGDTGGVAVRLLIWRSTLGLVAEHPLLGCGLGQFAREFPSFRAPEEIERSTHGRRIAQETEVEHAHDDYLTVLAEGGLLLGGAVLVLLGLVAWTALRKLRAGPGMDAALAAAALALLANGLVHGVLLYDPVSSMLAFGIFGALLGPVRSPRRAWLHRAGTVLLAVLTLLNVPRALASVEHARALQPFARGDELSTSGTEQAIEAALAAERHSVFALSLRARLLEAREVDSRLVASAWGQVLDVRPLRVEARLQRGLARLRAGDAAGARTDWEFARTLDPLHPGLLWNLMTLAFDAERVDDALALQAELAARDRADAQRLLSLAARLELESKEASAQALWQLVLPEVAGGAPSALYALAKQRREAGELRLAAAIELRAQRAWAREHALVESWADAVRSYRQALRAAAIDELSPSQRLRCEYACALSRAGREDEAVREANGLALAPADVACLPQWARERARERGWAPR